MAYPLLVKNVVLYRSMFLLNRDKQIPSGVVADAFGYLTEWTSADVFGYGAFFSLLESEQLLSRNCFPQK